MTEFIATEELVKDDRKNGIVSHCVFHCLSNLPVDADFREEYERRGGVEVSLTINGREVPFKKFLEEFERQHAYLLARQAERALDERMGRVQDALYDFEKAMKGRLRKLFPTETDE